MPVMSPDVSAAIISGALSICAVVISVILSRRSSGSGKAQVLQELTAVWAELRKTRTEYERMASDIESWKDRFYGLLSHHILLRDYTLDVIEVLKATAAAGKCDGGCIPDLPQMPPNPGGEWMKRQLSERT